MEKKKLPTIPKAWTISHEQRVNLAKEIDVLRQVEVTTMQHCSLSYDDICKLVSLLYTLMNEFGLEYKRDEKGHRCMWEGIVLKEENER